MLLECNRKFSPSPLFDLRRAATIPQPGISSRTATAIKGAPHITQPFPTTDAPTEAGEAGGRLGGPVRRDRVRHGSTARGRTARPPTSPRCLRHAATIALLGASRGDCERALIASALVTLREGSDERALRTSPPLSTYFLGNGLEVVLSPERTSPTVGVGVFYRAGFRLEPEGRTGFAHLFQNLMFQGTTRVPSPISAT